MTQAVRWSSALKFHLGVAGAAVGLGSIWRFPYLAGTGGGSAFILVFVLACLLIATPLLAAEYAIGRRARRNSIQAPGVIADEFGLTRRWNAIGIFGAVTAFIVMSYYTVIAGWVLAYTWKCASGLLTRAGPAGVQRLWKDFLASPLEMGAWHVAFIVLVAVISARGLHRGIESANRIRAPALLILLLILVGYSLSTGDVSRGLAFAFMPDFSALNATVVLSAIGQAFFATGVGMGMMCAYSAYAERGTSLVRSALAVSGSILLVSLLATLMVFPLVFAYGMDPAQGFELVFDVLPRVFTEMPAGRLIGTLFFLLLVLAALMPTVASMEPAVAWLVERHGFARIRAVLALVTAAWLVGIGTVLSFNYWAEWHPVGGMTFFGLLDYASSNILMPAGALLTSLFVGWRISKVFADEELAESPVFTRRLCVWLLRYLCPVAIVVAFVAAQI